jgi:hypothetical protein
MGGVRPAIEARPEEETMHEQLRTFQHHRLDAYRVALEALSGTERIAKGCRADTER